MRHFLDHVRATMMGFSAVVALAGPAHALLILPSFDPTSFAADPNAAGQEAAIQTAATTIDGLYKNPGTVQVLFEYNSGLGGGAETNTSYTFVPYSQYTNRLAAVSAANPQNTVLATAVAHLGSGNTGTYVLGTTALLRVGLGFTGAVTPCFDASGSGVSGCGAIYDAVISIGTAPTSGQGPGQNSQAVSEMEHELNEALGGGGAGTTIGDNFSSIIGVDTAIGPTDLYRYQSSGSTCANVTSTPSYTTSTSAVACYSIDGGSTALVQMNEAGGGSDYGDFANTSPINIPYIQDAFYPGFTNIYSTSSPEFIMMQSIGYDALPEPSTLTLFGGAISGLTWLRRRRARLV
jgi:hypothetical protein